MTRKYRRRAIICKTLSILLTVAPLITYVIMGLIDNTIELKDNKYFSLTFHSLSGLEWKAVSNACVFNNFNVVDYEWLEQKTYPPRQLNRIKSIKGDVLVTFRKNPNPVRVQLCDDDQFANIIREFITEVIQKGVTDTNGIMMAIMEWILRNMIIIGNVDVFMILRRD